MIKDLLTPNRWSRPQRKLTGVKGLVIHWVANPNTTAKNNRDYFEKRKYGNSGFGSAHYIIGLKGEVLQCIPDNEMAYHVGSKIYTQDALNKLSSYPNNCTIGIECCHVDWEGNMTVETYHSLVKFVANKLKEYNLTVDNLWLHKDIVGWKDCHRWFVNNPSEWIKFKQRVKEVIQPSKIDWRVQLGRNAVKKLHQKDIINNPEYWEDKMLEKADNWLMFELLSRILEMKW